MQKNPKEIIFEALRRLAIIKGQDITSERIELYCEILEQYPLNKTCDAIKTFVLKKSNFPDLPDIIAIIEPTLDIRDVANEMAGEIINAILKFGATNLADAKICLGDLAWYVVERSGGWGILCLTEIDNLGTLRAQLRDMSKMAIAKYKIDPNITRVSYNEKEKKPGMKRLGECISQTLSELGSK